MKDLKRAIQIVYLLCSDNTDNLSDEDKRWFFFEFLKDSELSAPDLNPSAGQGTEEFNK